MGIKINAELYADFNFVHNGYKKMFPKSYKKKHSEKGKKFHIGFCL